MYFAVKHLHVAAVALSFSLFMLRGYWMLNDSAMLQRRWVRIVPHINDTILLGAGIWLAVMLRQIPGVSGWLTAKIVALIVYIVLGTVALKRGRTRTGRIIAWLAALAVFGYIVAVALTKNPFPWINA